MISRRHVLFGLGGLAFSLRPALSRDFWGAPAADAPQDFIFGYGTLINEPSRTATSGRQVAAVPARISPAFGYVRAWVARAGGRSGAGFTALGLRPRGRGRRRPASMAWCFR
ncbi:hypothetical protein ACI7BZ_15850 [Xanthobacter sp. AM11]|uniref:hypothetical protein n=1 Tax=Xanthobacter sp. AM11 TaxID=3380643 RepID=UPI0039BF0CE1